MRDLYSNLDVRTSIVPGGTKSATFVGAAVDLTGMKSALMLWAMGPVAGGGQFAASLEESDDGVTWTVVAAKNITSDAPNPLGASWTYRMGYIGRRRYIRAVATYLSGTNGYVSAICVLRPLRLPVA